MMMPSMTQVQRDAIASPATGLLVFQTDTIMGFYFYNGTAWIAVGTGAVSSAGSNNNTLIYTTKGF
jgi:hypothetical protein